MKLFGTSYLGLQTHPEYLDIVKRNIGIHGINNPLSRNNAGQFDILEDVEASLAKEWNCEDACLLSSGYLAGLAVSTLSLRVEMPVVAQADGHPCYLPQISKRRTLREVDKPYGVIFDAVDPFTGYARWHEDAATLEFIKDAQFRAIDISHVAGVWSSDAFSGLFDKNTSVFGSLGKASAFPAGFVAGSKKIISKIRELPLYTASAAPAISSAASYLESTGLRIHFRTQLWTHLGHVQQGFKIDTNKYSFPTFLLNALSEKVRDQIKRLEITLSSLAYPSPHSPVVTRLVLNAQINRTECDIIINTFSESINLKIPIKPLDWISLK